MAYEKYLFTGFLLLAFQECATVKINVHGSVSMGKEILAFLEHYAIKSQFMGNRRSGSGSGPAMEAVGTPAEEKKDIVTILVRSQSFCQGLPNCDDKIEKLISSYIVVLIKSLENILEKLFKIGPKLEIASDSETILTKFHEGLKKYFSKVEDIVKRANDALNIAKDNKPYVWVGVLKKMNALFQVMTEDFLNDQLQQNRMEVEEIKKLLTQKMVIASAAVEEKYVTTLCQEDKICERSFYCTDTLHKILKTMTSLSDEKVNDFMKDFAAALKETPFYRSMNDPIYSEFQDVLDKIASPGDIKVKGILKIILNTVETRLQHLYEDMSKTKTQDIYLFHTALSDMDHFYNKQSKFPFESFQEDFVTWVKFDGHITPKLVKLFKEIGEQLALEPEILVVKVKNEVKTFLQITLELDN